MTNRGLERDAIFGRIKLEPGIHDKITMAVIASCNWDVFHSLPGLRD